MSGGTEIVVDGGTRYKKYKERTVDGTVITIVTEVGKAPDHVEMMPCPTAMTSDPSESYRAEQCCAARIRSQDYCSKPIESGDPIDCTEPPWNANRRQLGLRRTCMQRILDRPCLRSWQASVLLDRVPRSGPAQALAPVLEIL